MRRVLSLLALIVTIGSCDGTSPTNPCTTGLTSCGGTCVDLDTDDANCGSCGNACMAGMECNGAGACDEACEEGLTACDGSCVDTNTDGANCGSCGTACEDGMVCDGAGACGASCVEGLTACDDSCVDLDTDDANCGSCGNACDDGMECDGAGTCATACLPGNVRCETACINPLNDSMFCGATGDCEGDNAGSACAGSAACTDGACVASYSESFTQEVNATVKQCDDFTDLFAGLTASSYSSVTFYGSENPTGYTCTDPAIVAMIAEGLRTDIEFIVDCDGHDWQWCHSNGGQFWVDGGSLCNIDNCSGGAMLRPCISSGPGFWGGLDTSFCGGPTQTMTVDFTE